MKDIVRRPDWTALKIIVIAILLIATAAIIAGIPYIICKIFNLV